MWKTFRKCIINMQSYLIDFTLVLLNLLLCCIVSYHFILIGRGVGALCSYCFLFLFFFSFSMSAALLDKIERKGDFMPCCQHTVLSQCLLCQSLTRSWRPVHPPRLAPRLSWQSCFVPLLVLYAAAPPFIRHSEEVEEKEEAEQVLEEEEKKKLTPGLLLLFVALRNNLFEQHAGDKQPCSPLTKRGFNLMLFIVAAVCGCRPNADRIVFDSIDVPLSRAERREKEAQRSEGT